MTPKTEQDHLDMMRHPERWPQSLVLPLRHRTRTDGDGHGLLGFMFEDYAKREAAPKVYVGLIFFRSMGLRLRDLPVEEFPSLEAVIAAGWRVD